MLAGAGESEGERDSPEEHNGGVGSRRRPIRNFCMENGGPAIRFELICTLSRSSPERVVIMSKLEYKRL